MIPANVVQAHYPQQEPPVKELSSQEERANTQRQELGPHNSAFKKKKKKDAMGLYAALLQYTTKEPGKTCETTDSDSGTSNAGP